MCDQTTSNYSPPTRFSGFIKQSAESGCGCGDNLRFHRFYSLNGMSWDKVVWFMMPPLAYWMRYQDSLLNCSFTIEPSTGHLRYAHSNRGSLPILISGTETPPKGKPFFIAESWAHCSSRNQALHVASPLTSKRNIQRFIHYWRFSRLAQPWISCKAKKRIQRNSSLAFCNAQRSLPFLLSISCFFLWIIETSLLSKHP